MNIVILCVCTYYIHLHIAIIVIHTYVYVHMCLHCLQVIARKNVAPSVQQDSVQHEPTEQPNETAAKNENKGVRIYGYCARFV